MTQKLKRNLTANGIDIRTVLSADQQDYISLTDIAKIKAKTPMILYAIGYGVERLLNF